MGLAGRRQQKQRFANGWLILFGVRRAMQRVRTRQLLLRSKRELVRDADIASPRPASYLDLWAIIHRSHSRHQRPYILDTKMRFIPHELLVE